MAARSRSALRNWTEYVAFAGVMATLRYSPSAMAESFARFYVGLLDIAVPRYRRIAMRNLELAMPVNREQ